MGKEAPQNNNNLDNKKYGRAQVLPFYFLSHTIPATSFHIPGKGWISPHALRVLNFAPFKKYPVNR